MRHASSICPFNKVTQITFNAIQTRLGRTLHRSVLYKATHRTIQAFGILRIADDLGESGTIRFVVPSPRHFRRLLQLRQDFALSLAVNVRFASILLNQPAKRLVLRLTIRPVPDHLTAPARPDCSLVDPTAYCRTHGFIVGSIFLHGSDRKMFCIRFAVMHQLILERAPAGE